MFRAVKGMSEFCIGKYFGASLYTTRPKSKGSSSNIERRKQELAGYSICWSRTWAAYMISETDASLFVTVERKKF